MKIDTNRRRVLGFAGGGAVLAALPRAHGQEKFPSKPIEVVTHAGVGGGTDITARMMMVHAPGVFKTEFVVVNRVGGIAVVSIARTAGMQQPTIVPFRGGGDVVINLVGGNIDCALVNYAEAESQFKAGDIRALAVFADKPMAALSNVPTGKEIGVPASYSTVRGFVTLRGVPEANVKALEEGLVKAMNGQLFQTYIESSGQSLDSVVGSGPWQAQLDEFMVEGKKTLEALGLLK